MVIYSTGTAECDDLAAKVRAIKAAYPDALAPVLSI